mmetsp:Transcript_15169/g.30882  ORF Transcript_15169/g.30882 Transcript_15169/m.30882 type:complete len:382 (-) Transcript_15169:3-1148(-)
MTMIKEPIPLWIDTDTSGLVWSGLDCDDDLAVLAALALHKRQIISLDGISICGGNAPLFHTWKDILALWKHADGFQITNMQPVKGYGWRSMQVAVSWLSWYNRVRPDEMDSENASIAIIERSRDKSLDPVHILMLGPPTNLARAIDSDLLDQSGISHVYLMGGELTHQQLDLNFRTDRASARTIIEESNIPTTVIPIQTCAQTIVTESYLERLDCPSVAACALLPKMKQQIKLMPRFVNQAVKKRCTIDGPWRPSPNLDSGFIPWDLVALLAITHEEEFIEWKYHRVSIPPCDDRIGEPCDSTMIINEDFGETFDGRDWKGVVRIPHKVRDEEKLLDVMFTLLNEVPATSQQPPALFFGFYGEVLLSICLCIVIIIYMKRV